MRKDKLYRKRLTLQQMFATVITGCILLSFITPEPKPVLYIIGDSTVQNNDGNGINEYWGWGTLLKTYLDTNKIRVVNRAKPGASTRTFISQGLWQGVVDNLQPGDFVIMQFGHNDSSPVNDTSRSRGTLPGTGADTAQIINGVTHQPETVYSYGWYLQKLIDEAKAKGAQPVVCSPVPRERWQAGKVVADINYLAWAKAVALEKKVPFIDLNSRIAAHWQQLGPDSVHHFFPGDHTHTGKAGAMLNAQAAAEGIQALQNCELSQYIR